MDAMDLRRLAEEEVEKFHIFDKEWRDILVDEYIEILAMRAKIGAEWIRPITLITLN